MRLTGSQTWAIIGFASIVWLALSVFGVVSSGGIGVVGSLANSIPALLFGVSVYERWLWRWSPLHRVGIVRTPVVIGTWRGDLESFWEHPETHQKPPIKTVYLTVEQTVTTIAVRFMSDESSSEQVAGVVADGESGSPAIWYSYRNKPGIRFRDGNVSTIHYGTAIIEMSGDLATGLRGEYWTDRKTIGEFTLREHSPQIAKTFDEAGHMRFGSYRPVGALGRLLMRAKR